MRRKVPKIPRIPGIGKPPSLGGRKPALPGIGRIPELGDRYGAPLGGNDPPKPLATSPRMAAALALETKLAERAVILLDKLSRCVLHPYVIAANQNNLTQNGVTAFPLESFRNDQDGPFVITRMRATNITDISAASVGAIFSNVALQLEDSAGNNLLGKDAACLPIFFSRASNTYVLARPYVLDRKAAIRVRATELNVADTTDLYVALHGELVLGGMTAAEVSEAIALGVYPLSGQQSALWPRLLLLGELLGDAPPAFRGEAGRALERLRSGVWRLRDKLRAAEFSSYVVSDSQVNLTASGVTPMNRENLRNDQKSPFAVMRAVVNTCAAYVRNSATSPFDNVAADVYSTDEELRLTRTATHIANLFNYASCSWVLEHPFVLSPRGTIQVALQTLSAHATTDAHLSFLGEIVRGVSVKDLRTAVTLGLYPLIDRGYD